MFESRQFRAVLAVRDITQDDLRQPDHELSQPRIFFKQRNDVIARTVVIGKIVGPE